MITILVITVLLVALALIFLYCLFAVAQREDRKARHQQKRMLPLDDVTITRQGEP